MLLAGSASRPLSICGLLLSVQELTSQCGGVHTCAPKPPPLAHALPFTSSPGDAAKWALWGLPTGQLEKGHLFWDSLRGQYFLQMERGVPHQPSVTSDAPPSYIPMFDSQFCHRRRRGVCAVFVATAAVFIHAVCYWWLYSCVTTNEYTYEYMCDYKCCGGRDATMSHTNMADCLITTTAAPHRNSGSSSNNDSSSNSSSPI